MDDSKINRVGPISTEDHFTANVVDTRFYRELDVPYAVQAQAQERPNNKEGIAFALNYCGRDIVTIGIEGTAKAVMRHHSDGSVQSSPMIQQFFISAQAEVKGIVTLRMYKDAICMRPRRAKNNEAILAQSGRPLIYGVNGFYGIWEDILVEWYGSRWRWLGDSAAEDDKGSVSARFEVNISNRPFIILLRPRYYSEHLGYRYHHPWKRQPNRKAVSGWCSWEAYHADITEKRIIDAAKQMRKFVPYGLEYLQIDDGYQENLVPPEKNGKVYESWIHTNEKFPGGHSTLVKCISENDLTPAIWTNAVVNNEQAAETGYCMKENGKAFRGDWIQFILNCKKETLKEHVLPYYQKLHELGYQYFKSDALRHLFFDGLQECVRRGLLTGEEAEKRYRAFFECARKGIGDDAYLLSCWGGLTQCVGIADACRIATDSNPSWMAVQMQVIETARWFFSQRILFTVDPDHICVRMNIEWAKMLLTLVSLIGGVYMLSDPPECYDENRVDLIKKTLPSLKVYTAETGPVDYTTPAFCRLADSDGMPEDISKNLFYTDDDGMFGTLWATHFSAGDRRWAVITRTALLPLTAVQLPLANLGINPDRVYACYDFWRERFAGLVNQTIGLEALEIGHVQACAITPINDYAPVLIGSTRHVSMDSVSISSYETSGSCIYIHFSGIAGEEYRYCIYSKKPCQLANFSSCKASLEFDGEVYWLSVLFDGKEAYAQLTCIEK